MGTYCTSTTLQILMIGTDLEDDATSSLASLCIEHAENEINKYMSKRYDISLFQTAVPPMVKTWCEILSEAYIYKQNARGGMDARERAKDLIQQVHKDMDLVKDYELDLIDSNGDVIDDMPNTSYRVQCNTSDYTPTFNEDDPLKWKVDSDKLSDIEDERD